MDAGIIFQAVAVALTAISIVGGCIYKICIHFKKLKTWREEAITQLQGIVSDSTMDLIASPLFVNTMGQKEAPHDSEWFEESEGRLPLIDIIIEDIIKNKKSINKKSYFILGGSGMGKTTFLVALFYKYINKYKYKKSPYNIHMLSLSDPDVLDEIQKVPVQERAKSIIILDALDENIEATNDVEKFVDNVKEVTRKFKYVIITCRTQLFSTEAEEPSTSRIKNQGYNKIFSTFDKYYISPFTKVETYSYLERKFPLISQNYQKAISLVKECGDLMARPMILAHIDDLIKLPNDRKPTTAELYGTIINAWLESECKEQNGVSVPILYKFSKDLSLYMYDKWLQKSESYLTEDEFRYFYTQSGYERSPYSFIVARSLINRTSTGLIKFSHRSFWEFFLALCSVENPGMSFNTKGFGKAKQFADDIYRIDLNDNKLKTTDFINYQRRSFFLRKIDISRTLEKIQEAIIKIKKSSHCEHKKVYSVIYDIWESILFCWINLPSSISSDSITGIVTDSELLQHIKDAGISLKLLKDRDELEALLFQYQQHLQNVNEVLKDLSAIQQILNSIDQRMHSISSVMLPGGYIYWNYFQKEAVILPHTFDHKNSWKNIIEGLDATNLPVLGYGFNDCVNPDESVFNNIKKLIERTNYRFLYCIIRECKGIDDLVCFIVKLIKQVFESTIIVKAYINDMPICYFVCSKSGSEDEESIKKCISLMVKAKSDEQC